MSSSWAAAPGDSSWPRASPRAACGRSSAKSTPASAIPVHCTGVLSADSFAKFDLPATATLNQLTHGALSVAGRDSGRLHARRRRWRPSSIGRCSIARWPSGRSRPAPEIRVGARVTALDADRRRRPRRGRRRDRPRASGRARLRRDLQVPAAVRLRPADDLSADGAARAAGAHPGGVELHFGQDVAPGGFAWAVPVLRPEGAFVRIGVMASRDVRGCYQRMLARVGDRWGVPNDDGGAAREDPAARRGRPHLRRPDAGDRRRRRSREADHRRRHPLQHRQRRAGRRRGDCRRWPPIGSTRGRCPPTRRAWRAELAEEFEAQQELREIATSLSDEAIDSFFELAHTDGIMPIVRATARFNEHRPLIRALFKHPPARRILFRAMIA